MSSIGEGGGTRQTYITQVGCSVATVFGLATTTELMNGITVRRVNRMASKRCTRAYMRISEIARRCSPVRHTCLRSLGTAA